MASSRSTRSRSKAAAKTAPAVSGDPANTIAAATQPATTKENPASTTKANDPALESTAPGTTTAETTQAIIDAPAFDAGRVYIDPAAGQYRSHPAETQAELTLRLSGGSGVIIEMPAGDYAAPENNLSPTPADLVDTGSRHDESGVLQDATRFAIGAGAGSPDGVGDQEVPQSAEAAPLDDVEPVVFDNGVTFRGNKAKIWGMLEEGATEAEMKAETQYVSVLGLIASMAEVADHNLVTSGEGDERKYTVTPVEE